MFSPKVVGQSGTARAAPVLVTSPPKTISTAVTAAVTRASPCASLLIAAPSTPPSAHAVSVPGRRRHASGRLRLRKEVLLRLRRAVLVRAAVHGRQRRTPVQVRRRRGRRPLERVRVPGVHGRLPAAEEAPEEVDHERDLRDPEQDRGYRHEDVPVLLVLQELV